MEKIQDEIDKMYAGNIDSILSNVFSKNDFLVFNAILCGSKLNLKNDEFITGVKKAQSSEVVFLGYPLKRVAEAALHFLSDKKYTGDDNLVKSLIANKFNV